jgi:hypothetical protein
MRAGLAPRARSVAALWERRLGAMGPQIKRGIAARAQLPQEVRGAIAAKACDVGLARGD